MMELAHGVGKVYESPIPLSFYLAGAALTVLASFFIRAFSRSQRPHVERRIAGPGVSSVIFAVVKVYLLATFGLILVFAVIDSSDAGFGVAALLFWVAFIVFPVALCCVFNGLWPGASPWATIEGLYRLDDEQPSSGRAEVSPWIPPLAVYALFWFELVSGRGFDPLAILLVVLAYFVLCPVDETSFRGRHCRSRPARHHVRLFSTNRTTPVE